MFSSVLLTILVSGASAQHLDSEAQYLERMHDIEHSFAALRERPTKDFAKVSEEATKLAELFEHVEAFWKGRGDEEAAGFARMAKEGADEAHEAASKREQRALERAIETIARSCEGCHREPLDKYRFPKN